MDSESMGSGQSPHRTGRFPTTRWSWVAEAGDPEAPRTRAALAELCAAYWYPLYGFIRRKGYNADEALDLVQEYFARLLERGVLAAADPARGRFRTLLLTDCCHFLAKQRLRAEAQKRGGGRRVVPIEAQDAEGRYNAEPAHDLTPERLYERAWALTVLGQVLGRLRSEYQDGGKGALFDRLKVMLTDGPDTVPHAVLATELGTTEGAVRVAVHRLRRRYGALLRERIAATLADPADIDDEVRALFAALAR